MVYKCLYSLTKIMISFSSLEVPHKTSHHFHYSTNAFIYFFYWICMPNF